MSRIQDRIERMKAGRKTASGSASSNQDERSGQKKTIQQRLNAMKSTTPSKSEKPVRAALTSAGPLGNTAQNAKNRLSGRGVSGVSGSFPVSDAGTAAYERGVVSAITRQRDEAKADQLRAQARLQALSAGGWSADSPQARQAERETWNSLNASARQKAASERLKEIAASAQERYAREQAVRTARLPDADTLESRLEQAARERYQAEADIQRYSGLGLVLSPGGITENAGRLQEAVRAVEPAKERQEALRKDFDAVRNRDYNREQENQINEWIRSTPAGQGTAPDFSTATTPKQWQAAGAVRILLNPDRAAQTVSTGNAEGTWNATRLSFLTEEEKRAVLAYANAGDWETAANLLEALERTLNARQQESANERLYEESKEHPIVGAAANAILSYGQPYAYLEGVRQAAENIATGNYEPIDPNSFAMSGANLVQQTGQGVVDAVNGFFGKDVSFLTQTGLSILQNMARAPIAWVNPMASLGIMATGAGGASVLEGAQAGQDPAKTVALATAAGLAEYVTERVSLESLLETLKAGKTPLRQALFRVGKQMVTEGSEEAASEYLNLLADAVISSASSGMMQERDALMAAGFSRSEADAMAMTKYMAEQPALSALGGMISGGVMGGGAAALGNAMGALDERAQRQADSTAMNENGLVALTAQEQENLSSGKRNKIVSTVQDVVSFIRSALSDRTSSNRAYLGKIPDGTAQRVLEETGVDITGYNAILQSDNIRHIMKKHGDAATESARGQSPVTVEDIAQIPQVLSSPDRISLSNETDSRGRRVLVFEKLIGDNFVTMQAVTDGNHSIQTDTLFKQKRKNPQGTEYNASISASPAHNARSVPPQGSSTPMITEMGLERNGLTREQAGIIARIASGETVSEEEARQVAGSDMATEVLTRTLAERRGAVSEQEPVRRQAGEMARPASRAEAQVIEASSVFGENGRRASRAAYDGSISADRYVSGFAEYYEAGLSGLSMDEVQGRYGRALNEAQRLAAYDSGQRDAAAKLREEQARAQYASTAGTDSGLVLDSYVQQNLDGTTVNRLNAVSKALGVRVQFADRVRGGTANASITGSTILVEKGNPNPVLFVVGHEWTHRMQELAPEQYRAFRSAIAGEIQYDARELMARYKEQGVSLTMEEALDEAAADYAGRLLEDGALLDDFIKKHRSDRSLLEKLRDAIRTLIRKLTGKEKQLAQTAEGKLTAALEAARRQAERLQGQQRNDTMGQTRNSLKEDLTDGGERREETREAFARRAAGEGLTVVEGKTAAFGFRRVGVRRIQRHIQEVQKTLQEWGIECDVIDGPIEVNRNRITISRTIPDAATVGGVVFINNNSTVAPMDVAGHEAFHVWKGSAAREAYVQTVLDSLNFASEAFLEYQQKIVDAYFDGEIDLGDETQLQAFEEELFAYISGQLNDGGFESLLRPMFRDYDAVKAAWEGLVEENRSGPLTVEEPGDGEHGARYSLKELDGRHMPVIANTSYGALASKPERMAWLKEAKQGNRAAAQRLLDATLKAGLAEQVDEAFPDAVLVPVQYAGEGNVLPQLLAQRLARNGRHSLLETVHQTGRSGMKNHEDTYGRLMNPVQFAFDGPAPDLTGQRFVLVDDVISSGSTLMALKHAIEAQGGTVDGYVVLARGRYVAGDMAMKAETLRAIEMRLGRAAVEETLTGRLGYPVTLEALTEKQGRAILSHQEAFQAEGTVRALTAAERSAVLQYKSSESYKVNAKLRDGIALTEAEQEMVDALDRALEKLPRYEGTVYRRMSFDMEGQEALDAFLEEHAAGDIVPYEAYTSSSTEQDGYPVEGKWTVLQVIKGQNGRDLDGIGNNFEREVLFPRDTLFYVEKVGTDAEGNPIIYMEEVAEHGAGQLYSEERLQAVQQVQASAGEDSELQAVPKENTTRGAERGQLSGLRAEGEEHYSLKAGDGSWEAAQLRREADLLRDRVEYWKGQTRKSGEISIDGKATRRAARAILRQFSSSLDTDTLTESMTDLYNYMLRGGEDFSETEAYRKAEAIARQVVDGALEADDSLYSQYADLRAYLRDTPLSISETDRHDIADFNDFRKRNFGRLNIRAKGGTNIDQIYAELSAQWPEFFDQSRESHPADQLLRMAEVAEQLRQVDVRNPFSDSYWEAVQGAANELYQQFFDTPQARKTFADRQAAKLDAERARGRRRAAEQRERVERQLETVRQQNRERVQRAVQRERETRQRQVERLKDRYAEKTAADRERRSAAELRRKITRHAKTLSTQLLKPSNQQHVPERLRTAVAATLDAINQESLFTYDRSTGKRQKNQPGAPAKRTEAFLALREAYQAILTDNSQTMAIDPDLQGRLDELITLRDTPLSAMNTGQLTTVWNTLKAVGASVRNANRMLSGEQWETVARTAEALRRENVHKAQRRDLTGALGKLDRAVNLNNLTPEAFFYRLGATGEQLFEMLRKAQDRYITTVAKAQEEMAALVSGRVVQQLEREVHTFRLEQGGTVTLSTAQIMALRETMQDKQGRKHVLNGGIRPDNAQQRRDLYQTAASRSYRVTAGDLDAILSTLTKEQEALASRLQKYLAERMGETGNEASMQVYGYRKFTDPNYFPLESDRNQVRGGETEPGGGAAQGSSIENMGLAKARVENATNGVMVRSIFDVVSNHISDMATYGAYLPAMIDLQRVYNYQFFRRDGGESAVRDGSVKDVFTQVFGAGGNAYMSKLLQDINRSSRSENMSPLSALTGNYKAAAIAFNMRVVLQQPTAILRAFSELDAKYLTAGMVRRGDWEKVKRYAPIAVWKDWGYFDINTGRQMKNVLFSDDSRLERLKQAGMAMASRADSFAWSRLWNAVELEIKDTRGDLTPGSSAFYEAVAERFEGIIDKTQVVDGVLQRSQIMRSTSDLDKMAASFMGEPTKVYNMLMSAVYDYRNAEGTAKQAAGKHLVRTVFALTVSFAVNAVMQSVMDALRDDDREKDYWEKFFAAYTGFSGEEETFLDYWNSFWGGNLQANYNPLSYVPYVKDILSLLQGYDVKRMDLESISKVLTAGQGALRALQGNGKNTRASAFATLFAEVSRLFGLPVANLKRDVQAVVNTVANETDNYLLQYRMDKAMLDINYDGNRKNFLDLLYKAYENDREAYEIMYEDMVMSGFDPEAIRKGMESRMKKEQGVESVEDLTERYLTPEQERTYDRLYEELSSSRVWRAADDGQRAEVEDNLYQLAVKTDAGQRLQEKIDGGAAYGVSEADYLLYLAALEVADAENEDRSKRNGATDQREAEAAANMLAGLSDEGRAYLWQSTNKGWKESSNPFR